MASYFHLVWPVKYRRPILTPTYKLMVTTCMHQIALEKGITILALNGHVDHIHVLVELYPMQHIEWVVRVLKAGTSYWVNNVAKTSPKLYWAVGYYWKPVEPPALPIVRMYIENQVSHHRRVG